MSGPDVPSKLIRLGLTMVAGVAAATYMGTERGAWVTEFFEVKDMKKRHGAGETYPNLADSRSELDRLRKINRQPIYDEENEPPKKRKSLLERLLD